MIKTETYTNTANLTPEQEYALIKLISNSTGLVLYAGHYNNVLVKDYINNLRANLQNIERLFPNERLSPNIFENPNIFEKKSD